jgi:hypothetical protein
MLCLNGKEFKNLIFQNGTSSWGGTRKMPNAFTELGVSMLSSVLNSERAIEANIRIMRTFASLRKMVLQNNDIVLKLEQLDKKIANFGFDIKMHDDEIESIFQLINEIKKEKKSTKKITIVKGFKREG